MKHSRTIKNGATASAATTEGISMGANSISCRIAIFRTDNGLYGEWKNKTSPFSIKGWRGRRDHSISDIEVEKMLEAFFSEERNAFFTPFYASDYKHTYVSGSVLSQNKDVYLKHYKVHEAPLKIRARNLLRRTLAKKAMCAYYRLKEMGIDAVEPLFYARREGLFIPREAVFASLSTGTNQTLAAVLQREHQKGELLPLVRALGAFMGDLHRKGVLYAEPVTNLLPVAQGDSWRFVLCDLDEMRSLGGMTQQQRVKYLAKLRTTLFNLEKAALTEFDTTYHAAF
ncbi:MAG: hypothetical protein RBT11_08465 [Desulfobacterales bacterium]|nr:hypothetical protein [Desulfobacterales bacterium]